MASPEEELVKFQAQLEDVIAGLEADPHDEEKLALKEVLEGGIQMLIEAGVSLPESGQPTAASAAAVPHLHQNAHPKSASSRPTYRVGDHVLARWLTGDKGFYPARIQSLTGSSSNPIYDVVFLDYNDERQTGLRAEGLKPLPANSKHARAQTNPSEPKKRKADTVEQSAAPQSTPSSAVFTASAQIDAELAEKAKSEAAKGPDGPPRVAKVPKTVGSKGQLESKKNKWQEFQKGAKGQKTKKESMFRTGEGVNSRVGFTGSGKTMSHDPKRTRHVYAQEP